MPEQAISLFRSGVPLDSPLEDDSLWDLALITPGSAMSYLFHFGQLFAKVLLYRHGLSAFKMDQYEWRTRPCSQPGWKERYNTLGSQLG